MRAASGDHCAAAISAAAKASPAKPVLAVSFGRGTRSDPVTQYFAGVPVFMYPEQAVRALGAMLKVARYRERDQGSHQDLSAEVSAAREVICRANPRPPSGWLSMPDSLAVFAAMGIPVARHEVVRITADDAKESVVDEAVRAAEQVGGFPVVLKGDVEGLVRRNDPRAAAPCHRPRRSLLL